MYTLNAFASCSYNNDSTFSTYAFQFNFIIIVDKFIVYVHMWQTSL